MFPSPFFLRNLVSLRSFFKCFRHRLFYVVSFSYDRLVNVFDAIVLRCLDVAKPRFQNVFVTTCLTRSSCAIRRQETEPGKTTRASAPWGVFVLVAVGLCLRIDILF